MLRTCRCCGESFTPSPSRFQQKVCSKIDCQRQRKSRYHQKRCRNDPAYREDCRRSRKKWRDRNPSYHREYRKAHPEQVRHNREKQKPRDQLRRIRKQALQQKAALHLHPVPGGHSPAWKEDEFTSTFPEAAPIGLVSAEARVHLDKNNLAPP